MFLIRDLVSNTRKTVRSFDELSSHLDRMPGMFGMKAGINMALTAIAENDDDLLDQAEKLLAITIERR